MSSSAHWSCVTETLVASVSGMSSIVTREVLLEEPRANVYCNNFGGSDWSTSPRTHEWAPGLWHIPGRLHSRDRQSKGRVLHRLSHILTATDLRELVRGDRGRQILELPSRVFERDTL